MVEVTIELDEDMTRDDPSTELLPEPEPLLMIMSPPPPFLPVPGEPTMSWDRWKNSFEQYLEALGETDLDLTDSMKCALLQHCLGHEGQRVYAERVQGEASYAAAIFALTTHFESCHNTQTYPLEFQQREQRPGEPVEDFVFALQEMLRPCTFGKLKDELVLQQLMKKTNCKQLRERLMLEEKTLTLANTLTVGKEIEYSLTDSALPCTEIVTMDNADKEDTGNHTVQLLAQRRARRYEESENIKAYICPCFSDCNKDDSIDKQSCSGNENETDKYNEFGTAASHKYNTRSRRNGVGGAEIEDETHNVSKVHNGTKTEETIICKAKKKGKMCPICTNKSFRNAYKLARHMRTHTQDKPFSCHVCNMTFSQSYHMTRHLRNQHGADKYVCYKCGKDFRSSTELKTHRNIHVQEVLSRPDHDKRSQEQSMLFNQIEPHSKGLSKQAKSHKSRVCDGLRKPQSYNKYNAHTTDKHHSGDGNEIVFGNFVNCDINSSTVDISCDEVEYHDGGRSKDVVSKTKTKGNYCPICINKSFRNAYKLARHIRTHTQAKPFSCYVCNMTFSQSYNMTRHLRNQHGAGSHVCYKCGKDFSSSTELKTHRNIHVQEVLSCADHDKRSQDQTLFNQIEPHSKSLCKRTKSHKSRGCGGLRKLESHNTYNSHTTDKHYSGDGNEIVFGNSVNCKVNSTAVDTSCDEVEYHDGGKSENVVSKTKTKGKECPICINRSFRNAYKLARHMRMHTKDKPFSCYVCNRTFSQSYNMTKHLRNQHGADRYVCYKCGKDFSSSTELKTHKEMHVQEISSYPESDKLHPQRLVCTECSKKFTRRYHLKRHMAIHNKSTEKEFYKCPDCPMTYTFMKHLKKHLEMHQKEKNGTCDQTFCPEALETQLDILENSNVCTKCGKKFVNENALKKHKEERFYCSVCDKHFCKMSHYKRHAAAHFRRESKCPHCECIFLHLKSLKNHLRTHSEERPYQCPCCVECFSQKEDLEYHCLKHRRLKKEKPYSCTRCDHAFASLMELTTHMSTHKGEQPMNCPECGKIFLNRSKLRRHMSIHTGERPHLCATCGHGFPSAAGLKIHMYSHTGERPFKCSLCSKSYRTSSGLRLHSRHHMGVQSRYPCPDCGRTYGRMAELRMHQRYHTGDKPHSCTCCNKSFISKYKLNVHMRIHTGERPYSCSQCGQAFKWTGDRNRHMSKCH